jgi:hypothetical protein
MMHFREPMLLTQIQVVLHGVVQYLEQLYDVRVVQLLQDRDLSIDPVQGIRRGLVPVRGRSTCVHKDGFFTNRASSSSMPLL